MDKAETLLLAAVLAALYGLAIRMDEVAVSIFLLALGIAGWLSMLLARRGRMAQTLHHPFAYPGWVLFTGLGALIWVDYAARANAKHDWLGASHLFSLGIAFIALGISARFGSLFLGWIARIWARFDRASGMQSKQWSRNAVPWVLSLLCIVAIWANTNIRYPSKSAELIRLLACVVGSWMIYRWSFKTHHAMRIWLMLVGLFILTIGGLGGIHDYGQIMVLGWVGAVILGALIALSLTQKMGQIASVLVGFVIACSLVVSTQWGMNYLAENYPAAFPKHLPARVDAIHSPFEGELEYLSQIRWFLHTTPATGHGLGNVPWCGTMHALKPETKCYGVPFETHSDYVFTALAGVWGLPAAIGITALLAWWLLLLIPPIRPNPAHVDSTVMVQSFGQIFVLATVMQLLMTCLGNIGIVILTGVNHPLIGFGGTNLILCAVCLGVLMNRPFKKEISQ